MKLLQLLLPLLVCQGIDGFTHPLFQSQNRKNLPVGLGVVMRGNDEYANNSANGTDVTNSRRSFINTSISLWFLTSATSVTAAIEDGNEGDVQKRLPQKPRAPITFLLPATRVRLDIRESIDITSKLLAIEKGRGGMSDEDLKKQEQLVGRLKTVLLDRKSYMTPTPTKQPKRNNGGEGAVASERDSNDGYDINKRRSGSKIYQEVYQEKIKNISPTDVPLALLTQFGESGTAKILKERQSRLEEKNAIRAALNFYTSKIQFDTEYYQLNASQEDRKRMIRNDSLPSIQSVIVSDLDLRDLKRNKVLDLFEEAQAEFKYQISPKQDGFSAEELLSLLNQANSYCDEWFSFIPENDVIDAESIVLKSESN